MGQIFSPCVTSQGTFSSTLIVLKGVGDSNPDLRPSQNTWSPSHSSLQRVHSHIEMSSSRPPPSRRERSLSTVLSSPCITPEKTAQPLITPVSNSFETKAKRRSISTGGHLSVSPPTKTLKSDIIRTTEDNLSPTVCLSPSSVGMSDKPPIGFYTIAGSSKLRDREFRLGSKSGVHVRFSSVDDRIISKGSVNNATDNSIVPTRCHHLATAAAQQLQLQAAVNQTGDSEQQQLQQRIWFSPGQPQTVQRTQSNPEMEYCPVCLARKECEILLKRTYSKVNKNLAQTHNG